VAELPHRVAQRRLLAEFTCAGNLPTRASKGHGQAAVSFCIPTPFRFDDHFSHIPAINASFRLTHTRIFDHELLQVATAIARVTRAFCHRSATSLAPTIRKRAHAFGNASERSSARDFPHGSHPTP
jgi:hypothetical protein